MQISVNEVISVLETFDSLNEGNPLKPKFGDLVIEMATDYVKGGFSETVLGLTEQEWEYVNSNNKLQAVKSVKARLGFDLMDSKKYVEKIGHHVFAEFAAKREAETLKYPLTST